MRALVLIAAILTGTAWPAPAQVAVEAPAVGGPLSPPYGQGFNRGVVVGPRDGCRNFNCRSGEYQNRPVHRRYYDRYFDVPKPEYSRPRVSGGNRALGGTHRTDTLPITGADVQVVGRHRDWCAGRYRSYRAADNSFQSYNGPRPECVSPFW